MITYQDLQNKKDNVTSFIDNAISTYKGDLMYTTAVDAELYARMLNPTIMQYRKMLNTLTGDSVVDIYSANHKCVSNFFHRFITQENQYLLGNGVTFENEQTKEKLGGADFDTQLQKAGLNALIGGVSYGFLNVDHIEVFKAKEFVPLWDEENGALRSGIRFWQIDSNKPLRATLFEEDG